MSDGTHLQSVMILDDDADFRKLLITVLGKKFTGVKLIEYDPVALGVPGEDFDWSKIDVLLLDYYLCIHGVTGLDILQNNRKNKLFPATIMLTGAGNEEVAVRAIKAGVYDYLRKETLDKDRLHMSILEAFEKHKIEQARLNELTNQSHAFNKALFYQELEQNKDNFKRVLVLIELDNHHVLEQRFGVILRDNIIRHIAKQSFEIYKLGNCHPSITRFGDASIALLIDYPGSKSTLEFNLQGLCTHLKKHPYRYEDKKIRTTVSIGALFLGGRQLNAEEFIRHVRNACQLAATQEGDSFYIYDDADWDKYLRPPVIEELESNDIKVQAEPRPAPEPPVDRPLITPAPVKTAAVASIEQITPVVKPASKPEVVSRPAVKHPPPRPAQAAKSSPASLPESDDAELSRMVLSAAAAQIKHAFNDKRAVQIFQPVISLINQEDDHDVYIVAVQIINKDGSVMPRDDFERETNLPEFRKFIDRWMLREIIGRIVGRLLEGYVFFMKISGDTLADAKFFTWLRKLLHGLEKNDPGRHLILEIAAGEIRDIQKPVTALMSFFKKTHGIRFVLTQTSDIDEMQQLSQSMHFDMVRANFETVSKLKATVSKEPTASAKGSILQLLKDAGLHIIVDDVRDATQLTDTISLGVDYAAGKFIGEPMNQLDDITNVESFEII